MERQRLIRDESAESADLWFERVARHLGDARRICLLSPDGSGERFRALLGREKASRRARILDCRHSDSPSDAEIATLALEHFARTG